MKNKNIIIIVIVALIILITLGIIFISQKATNKTGSTNLNPIEKQEDLSTLIDEIYKGKEAVSYTHLDVYKRQGDTVRNLMEYHI